MIRISQIDSDLSIYKNNTVVLYGDIQKNKNFFNLFDFHNIKISYICDENKTNWGEIFNNIPIVSPTHLEHIIKQKSNKGNIVVQECNINIDLKVRQNLSSLGIANYISFTESKQVMIFIKNLQIKNNDDFKCAVEPVKVLRKKDATEYYYNNVNSSKQLLYLCLIPKTGDHTLVNTFNKNKIPFHNTWHIPYAIDRKIIKSPIKLITAVRNPIEREISGLFENISFMSDQISIESIYDNFLKHGGDFQEFFNKRASAYTFPNFMKQFSDNILDLSNHHFDKEKGFSIIKEDNIEIFVYQLERMNDIVNEMSDWIGETPFTEWVMGNEASGKWIADSYNQAKKEITFSQEYFDRCYNDKWIQHFYSQEDIEKFKERWRPHIR